MRVQIPPSTPVNSREGFGSLFFLHSARFLCRRVRLLADNFFLKALALSKIGCVKRLCSRWIVVLLLCSGRDADIPRSWFEWIAGRVRIAFDASEEGECAETL